MFKRGDKVFHVDYGTGVVWDVNPDEVFSYTDKDNKTKKIKGIIEIAFDSELGECDGNGKQTTLTFLHDGRENPIGSGYFWSDTFNEFDSSINLIKLKWKNCLF